MNTLQIQNNSKIEIKHNLEDVKKGFEVIQQRYNGLVVTEDIIKETKNEIAEINKIIKNINDQRILISKEIEAPSKQLKSDCDDVLQIGKNVVEFLNSQIKSFEDIEKAEKQGKIELYIVNIFKGYRLDEFYKDRFEIKSKWLNKTTTMKSIEEEITSIAEGIKEEIKKQEENNKLLNERTEAVNKINSENAKLYGFDLGISKYLYSEYSIVELMDIIKNDYISKQEEKRLELLKKKEEMTPTDKGLIFENGVVKNIEQEIVYSIKFRFKESNKQQINDLLLQIRSLSTGWVKE